MWAIPETLEVRAVASADAMGTLHKKNIQVEAIKLWKVRRQRESSCDWLSVWIPREAGAQGGGRGGKGSPVVTEAPSQHQCAGSQSAGVQGPPL